MKQWHCDRCDWTGTSDDNVIELYHYCQAPLGHPLGELRKVGLPATPEERAQLWRGLLESR